MNDRRKLAASVVRNLAFVGGCAMAFVGLWWERPAVALIAVGALLAWAGAWSARQVVVQEGPVDDR